MSKTKTELSKMTKKNLLLHIEKLQRMLDDDHLETQGTVNEVKGTLSKYVDGTAENKLAKIRSNAGRLRYQLFHYNFESREDKYKVIKMVDNFMNKMV